MGAQGNGRPCVLACSTVHRPLSWDHDGLERVGCSPMSNCSSCETSLNAFMCAILMLIDQVVISMEHFLRTVLNELNSPIPQTSLTSSLAMLEYIVCQMRNQQQILVLCIDEFEGLCTAPDFQLSFLEHLRALAQIGLVLVTASKRPLLDVVSEVLGRQGKTSPFFNIFEQLTLKPFNEYEAQKFVKEKSIQAGFLQQECEMLLRYGQTLSQQWPPLRLQLVGKMLETDKHLALHEDAGYYRPHDAAYWMEFEQRLEATYHGVVQ